MIKGAVARDGYKKTELGWIPEDWEVKRLGELCAIDSENLSNNTSADYVFKYISLENIEQGLLKGFTQLSFKEAPSRARRIIQKNDVLLATVRPNLLSHYFVKDEVTNWVCSTGFSVLRSKNLWTNKFIFYHLFFKIIMKQIESFITGSNYPAINSSDVKSLKIPLPLLPEQKKIAKILSTWDEVIEKLNSYIEAKKKLKKALMQKLLTGKQRFKEFVIRDSYKKTELGWIPEDWEVKRLRDVVDCQSGGTPSRASNELWNGSIPWMKIEDMTKANKYLFKTSENITEEGLKASSARLFLQETVFLAMYASVGKVCISKIPVTCNQAILGFYQSSSLDMEYLYYYLLFIEKLWQRNIQTGSQPNLNKNIVIGLQIFYPPLSEQKKIAEILSKADEEIDLLNQELEKLKTQKKGLMQKLLTGAWRVQL